jgi:AbrB family looped-hinge helix DNA binding protein
MGETARAVKAWWQESPLRILLVRQYCLTLSSKENVMVRLKVTAKGQITLKKEVLDHLGISPGDEVDVDLLPEGGGAIRAVGGKRKIESLFGMFAHKADRAYSVEEINEAIAAGYAGEIKF